MFIRYILLLAFVALLVGCATGKSTSHYVYPYGSGYAAPTQEAKTATKEQVEMLIQQSESTVQQIPVGYEWRFTGRHIKDAKKLVEGGKYEAAYLRASRALFEAETALQQAHKSQKMWPQFVVESPS